MAQLPMAAHTLPMSVERTGFLLDRLGQDCASLQFLRELTQNAIEACLATTEGAGEIIWDVAWAQYTLTDVYKLSIIDTGVGMSGDEMIQYINKLSSSGHEQSHEGNFGVGAKVAAATRNHAGLVYLSWKEGRGAMIHLWRDAAGVYGLRQFERPDGSYGHWVEIADDIKPEQISDHGTMVILFGNSDDENTMTAPIGASSPSRWVTYYLNTRYYKLPEGITLRAREGWEYPRDNTDTNVLRKITGQKAYLDQHALSAGDVDLTDAVAHWWILKDEKALGQNSGILASSGHMAALYQDELYEMVTGRGGTARLQNFGVLFGHNRVVIYVEPVISEDHTLTANTARTQLVLDGGPLPWAEWAAEFRSRMPEEIEILMEEVTSGTHSSDHRQAIRDRLKQIRDLFKLSRFRPNKTGDKVVAPDSLVGGKKERSNGGGGGRSGGGSGSSGPPGNVYALFLAQNGIPADEVSGSHDPEVVWITAEEGTRIPPQLDDRAAKYLHDQNRLLINGDFRVFTDFTDRWCSKYGDVPGARDVITDTVREWFEQALIEAVIGTRALRGSREWSIEDLKESLSEEALTAAVMPRYHIEQAVKRALGARLGSLKERV